MRKAMSTVSLSKNVHFHELGTMDAVADIVGSCMLMEELAPELILASPVHVGSGHIHCKHGVLPVPAPATAHIFYGASRFMAVPYVENSVPPRARRCSDILSKSSGLCQPCGFPKWDTVWERKDFEVLSCLRSFLGDCA